MKRITILAAGALLPLILTGTAHAADPGTTTVTGTFTAATDTPKPINDTAPRGTVTFTQTGPSGSIAGTVTVTGLGSNKAYLAVAYTDGACAPTPGVTAFPTGRFVTDQQGNATATVAINPKAVNPAASLDLRQVRSVSMREAAASSDLPVGPPNVPFPVTEACDGAPVVTQ